MTAIELIELLATRIPDVGYVFHSPGHGLAALRGVGALARAEALPPLLTAERGVHQSPGGPPHPASGTAKK